jgi:DNA-binding NarL/FixJ family response regulator
LWGRALVKLVIVDDEPLYLQSTKEIMMTFDEEMDIQTSTSPMEAIELVRSSRPDCVISDYRMPEMDGIEFTRRLRESSGVPVIMCTSHFDEKVAEEAFKAGVNDYVMKTSDAEQFIVLFKRIRNAVDLHRMELEIRRRSLE